MIRYSTIIHEGRKEQIIEKSRFIAYAKPVNSKEEADEFIDSIRKMNKDASHNVPAMVIGDKFQIQWGSDDGEPQGTSGAPMVQMLVKEGITNVAIVVTRYFGGIKLGTGGLVRAYTSSAKLALIDAEICDVKEMVAISYQCDYAIFNRLQAYNFNSGTCITNIEYTDLVTFDLLANQEDKKNVEDTIVQLSSGTAVIKGYTERMEKVKK